MYLRRHLGGTALGRLTSALLRNLSAQVLATHAQLHTDEQPPELEGSGDECMMSCAGESAAVDIGSGGPLEGDRNGGAHAMQEGMDDEDNEFLDRADRFEHAYNFRCSFRLSCGMCCAQ
jgi:hypothetical protein